jgi:uncharacterized protein (TIGR00369 family)
MVTERRVIATQNVSRMCVVCGRENQAGLHARFFELEDGRLLGTFVPRDEHQGYPGRLHGGVATTILDETIGRAINITDARVWGVTVELTVKFRKPVPIDTRVHALARITRDTNRLFEGSGEIVLADGTVAVEARGTYLRMPIDKIAQADFAEEDWFPDERESPETVDV